MSDAVLITLIVCIALLIVTYMRRQETPAPSPKNPQIRWDGEQWIYSNGSVTINIPELTGITKPE